MAKCALVLEGGGNRGIFTSGVLDAFIKAGVEFPYVIGVSYGACNGVSFLGKNYRRQHDMIINYTNDKRYMSANSFFKNGEYLNLEWCFGELSYDIMPLDHDTFENCGSTFCVVATEAETGRAKYMYPTSFREFGCPEIKASCAMPIITKGVEIEGTLLYDGGVSDSIPLRHALEDGCEKAVVILTRDRDFVMPGMDRIKGAVELALKPYPLLAKATLGRHLMYAEEQELIKKEEEEGKVYAIYPQHPLDCSAVEKNTTKLEVIYQLGLMQGEKAAEEVKEFINA